MLTVHAEIEDTDPARITIRPDSKMYTELLNKVPGATFSHKEDTWKLPISWTGCLALRGVFKDALAVGPNLSKWSQDEYEKRILPSYALRESTEHEGSDKLYPYQRAGVGFLTTATRAILADEMGTGKTRQSIMALMQLFMNGENPFPALIIAPNSTKISWKREADMVWPGLTVQIVQGSATQRRKQLETPAHVYIMNWESVRNHSRLARYGGVALRRCVECGGSDPRVTHTKCQVHERELNQMTFNTVIVDEAHRLVDPKSQQARAIRAATGDAKFRFALTGTPVVNAPDDLWTILNWLSPEEYPSRQKYIDRFCSVSYNAFGAATVVGLRADTMDEFFAGLRPRLRRMPKSLVLKFLPPVIRERRDVEMTPKQAKAYKQMNEVMIAELDDGELLMTTSPLTRVMRMLQFASSYATLETREITDQFGVTRTEEYVRLSDPSCKLDAFIEDMPDFGENSVIVFAVSRQLIEMLSARLTKLGISHGLITGAQDSEERQEHMDNFQAGKTKYILCTIAAGGTGITLTKGRIMAFLQRSWSNVDNMQAEARGHRIGSEQHESVTVIDYVVANTLEEVVINAVEQKSERLEQILRDKDLLKRALSNPLADVDEV